MSSQETPPFPQAAPKASMASTAVRSATVPTGAAATASMGPASVTRGCTAASATWVSPADRWAPGSGGGCGATEWAVFVLSGSSLCLILSLHR